MRPLALFLTASIALATSGAQAQPAKGKQPAAASSAVRYFQFSDLMGDITSDAILKETRRGAVVTSAVLDLCFSVAEGTSRKDRAVLTLNPESNKFAGSGQTQEQKLPVSIQFTRRVAGKTFAFEGSITHGATTTKFSSAENSDQSETEFKETQSTSDDRITADPANFTGLDPSAVAVEVKHDSVGDLVKLLKTENVRLTKSSLVANCAELRGGQRVVRMDVDPERAPALVAKLKMLKGVVVAGWESGGYSIDNAVQLPGANWHGADGKIERKKLAAAISAAAAKALAATVHSSEWNDVSGELTVNLKRPSQSVPGLDLTDNIAITLLAGPEKLASNETLVIWVGDTAITTADEGPQPRFTFSSSSSGEGEEANTVSIAALLSALASGLSGKFWDSEKSAWK
jgi:hypothetical protein